MLEALKAKLAGCPPADALPISPLEEAVLAELEAAGVETARCDVIMELIHAAELEAQRTETDLLEKLAASQRDLAQLLAASNALAQQVLAFTRGTDPTSVLGVELAVGEGEG